MSKTLCFCWCLMVCGWTQALGDSKTYRAAVVEYNPVLSVDENTRMAENVAKFITLIKAAKGQAADIIVFPEGGLMTSKIHSPIPDPSDKISPCDTPTFVTTEAVRNLSCASKENKIYTVINLPEKRACKKDDKNCPDRGYYLYNTNAVFDRKGVVVARYSKFNLYDEKMDRTEKPEISFFDTDFGVRFGTFVCFDILFGEPATTLLQKHNVTNFLFTTYWFSELPFLTALQVHRGWSETNNANLLASGVNQPLTASFGSGIYNGKRGAVTHIMPEKPVTQLLVADVPKTTATEAVGNYSSVMLFPDEESKTETVFLRDHMELFGSEVIEPGKTFDKKLCDGKDFCCDFRVSAVPVNPNDAKKYTLRAVILDGVRKFGLAFKGGVQCCGVLVCGGPHIMNCSSRIREMSKAFKFNEIKISGSFLQEQAFQMPVTLTDGEMLEPLTVDNYMFKKTKQNGKVDVTMESVKPLNSLQSFGVWGRTFKKDSKVASLLSALLP